MLLLLQAVLALAADPLTIQNKSGVPICSIEVKTQDPANFQMAPGQTKKGPPPAAGPETFHRLTQTVADGASVQVPVTARIQSIKSYSCEGELAIAMFNDGPPASTTVVIAKPGTAAPNNATVVAAPRSWAEVIAEMDKWAKTSFAAALDDATLTGQILAAAKAKGVEAAWKDTPRLARIASAAWTEHIVPSTNKPSHRTIVAWIGHDFGNNHCTVQPHVFRQSYDGRKFSGPILYEGSMGMVGPTSMSCALYDWLAAQPRTVKGS